MILYRWQGAWSNFGDELNTLLWPVLLPGFFDEQADMRFIGIGSVLDQRHPDTVRKLVAGSGYGGYEKRPNLDRNWTIHWVRGPRTAAGLGLTSSLALGDPALLAPPVLGITRQTGGDIGFMPHFESAARGAWQLAAHAAGIRLIDPRDPPATVLQAIGECRVLLSEALHGVIVADAMRVPWVAIRPRAAVHRAKWLDWADGMGVRPRFRALPASTPREWLQASGLASRHTTRTWLQRRDAWLAGLSSERMIAQASQALRRAAAVEPQLTGDAALDRSQSRMLDAVHALSLDPWRVSDRRMVAVSLPRAEPGWRVSAGDEAERGMAALVRPSPARA